MWDWFDEKTENGGCLFYICALLLILALAFGLMCLEAWVVMLLWNFAMPYLWATAPQLPFWATLCLMILLNILTGGIKCCCCKKDKD